VKKFQTLSFLATLAVVIGLVSWGSVLHAQSEPSTSPDRQAQQPSSSPDTTPSQQTPSTQTPDTTPNAQTPSQNPPAQPPDTTAPESGAKPGTSSSGSAAAGANENAGASQTFSGTVVKQGDKYVLKDDAGKVYDIDHQSDVAKFEGKRVRVQGTLDSNGKIMVK
jgi:uncharacterized protein YdeI (BOF family)